MNKSYGVSLKNEVYSFATSADGLSSCSRFINLRTYKLYFSKSQRRSIRYLTHWMQLVEDHLLQTYLSEFLKVVRLPVLADVLIVYPIPYGKL
jgi:hypothetical protein